MKNNIEGFPNYHFDGELVWNINKDKILKKSKHPKGYYYYKLKTACGSWKSISYGKVEVLSGLSGIPEGFTEVPHTEGTAFVDENGRFFRRNAHNIGQEVIPNSPIGSQGKPKYLEVNLLYKGKFRVVELHQLMCVTFYDKDYVEKGLVCLHKDNDKTNPKLSNLRVGTYSENNKQSYDDGINKGNVYGLN
ncbi:HNH nuclease [Vibrio phage 1.161.O._10N.261.48.C5]|nr:HNH nuclease [Vibrio phage 1.161.O._10N.261.48.C5]